MAKLFEVLLKIESAALGDVLMKLRSTPGIVDFVLNLDDKKAAAPTNGNAPPKQAPKTNGRAPKGSLRTFLLTSLAGGQKTLDELRNSGPGGNVPSAIMRAKTDKVIKNNGSGTYELTPKGAKEAAALQQGE